MKTSNHIHTLEVVDSSKYLGVTFSDDLTCKKHIEITVNYTIYLLKDFIFGDKMGSKFMTLKPFSYQENYIGVYMFESWYYVVFFFFFIRVLRQRLYLHERHYVSLAKERFCSCRNRPHL